MGETVAECFKGRDARYRRLGRLATELIAEAARLNQKLRPDLTEEADRFALDFALQAACNTGRTIRGMDPQAILLALGGALGSFVAQVEADDTTPREILEMVFQEALDSISVSHRAIAEATGPVGHG